MGSRPLGVLLVSPDRALLRCLGRFLGISGYEVQQVADLPQTVAALEAQDFDFWIVDTEVNLPEAMELCRSRPPAAGRPRMTLFLAKAYTADDLRAALEAGVDDFLAKPVVYGEILARLRAAARELEFQRRLDRLAVIEPVTGLMSHAALLDRLEWPLAEIDQARPFGACLVLEIDHFGRIARQCGNAAADTALRAAAARLGELAARAGGLASLGDGRFAVIRSGLSDHEAAEWADRFRATLGEEDIDCGSLVYRFTWSAGLAQCDVPMSRTAEGVLREATEALAAAKASGGNCLVRFGDLEAHAKAWADFAAPGKLFQRTLARDVMIPWPVVLRPTDSATTAAALLARTQLGALPVVDASGRMVGLFSASLALLDCMGEDHTDLSVHDRMEADPPAVDEQTNFAALCDFFAEDSRSPLVIVSGGRPSGFVTPESLAALGGKITADSFAPRGNPTGADHLIVAPVLVAEG